MRDVSVQAHHPTRLGRTQAEQEATQRQIRQHVIAGFNDQEIARELGCSDQTVFRYRKKHGLTSPRKL